MRIDEPRFPSGLSMSGTLSWADFLKNCQKLVEISTVDKQQQQYSSLKWSFNNNGEEGEGKVTPGALYISSSFFQRYPLSSTDSWSSISSSRNKPEGINLLPQPSSTSTTTDTDTNTPVLSSTSTALQTIDCSEQKNSSSSSTSVSVLLLPLQTTSTTDSSKDIKSVANASANANVKDLENQKLLLDQEDHLSLSSNKPNTTNNVDVVINANEAEAEAEDYQQELNNDDTTTTRTNSNSNIIKYDLHILYSLSYSAPVLYFNVSKFDGSLLKIEDILTIAKSKDDFMKNFDIWSTLTQQDHPILNLPFYTVHPCNTCKFMENFTMKENGNYVITWLSIVCNLIGIDLPIEYAKYV